MRGGSSRRAVLARFDFFDGRCLTAMRHRKKEAGDRRRRRVRTVRCNGTRASGKEGDSQRHDSSDGKARGQPVHR